MGLFLLSIIIENCLLNRQTCFLFLLSVVILFIITITIEKRNNRKLTLDIFKDFLYYLTNQAKFNHNTDISFFGAYFLFFVFLIIGANKVKSKLNTLNNRTLFAKV